MPIPHLTPQVSSMVHLPQNHKGRLAPSLVFIQLYDQISTDQDVNAGLCHGNDKEAVHHTAARYFLPG